MQVARKSIDDDKGAEEAAGIDCNVKTAIKDLLVTFQECEEDAEIEREMLSEISSYAAALGTAQCCDDAEPAGDDTAAASNEEAEGARKNHSETCSSEEDSSSESEDEFTIKTNSHLSSAMTLVLNRRRSCCRSGGPRSGEGKRGRGRGRGTGGRGRGRGGRGRLAGGSDGQGAGGVRVVRYAVLKQQTTRTCVVRPAGWRKD